MTLHLPAPDLELDPAFWVRYWAAMARIGTDREGTTVRIARPTFLDVIAWLWRWLADTVVALLTHPTAGRHSGHVGASDESVAELVDIRQALTDTEVFPAVVDVLETGFTALSGDLAETAAFTWLDRLDADRTFVATLRAVGEWPPDSTEVALTAAARQAGGAA